MIGRIDYPSSISFVFGQSFPFPTSIIFHCVNIHFLDSSRLHLTTSSRLTNMSNSDSINSHPHIAFIPSSGMGHLVPFVRFAALLVRRQCKVTLIITDHLVSSAESQLISRFLSAFPQVDVKKFTPLPLDRSTANSADPFALQWETIRRSTHLLSPILSSLSPPLSFVISDVALVSPLILVTQSLRLPNYVLFISCARMITLFAHFSSIAVSRDDDGSFQFGDVLDIPGIDPPIPRSSLPPPLLNSNSLFAKIFLQDSPNIMKLNGVLLNTFDELEKQTLQMLSGAKIKGLPVPPMFAVGPLLPEEFEGKEPLETLKWLDDQKEGSVVFVGFGSRTASSNEQIRELGKGLLLSGCKFLWVVKTKIVDKEEEESFNEILGHDLMERINNSKNGLVVKWVNQWEILNHKAVGGFMSHCGWNSIVEAALYGVPLLAWPQPQFGDHRIIGEAIEKGGWVLCMKSWGWVENALVKGEEIGEKVKELIGSESLKIEAARISEAAKKAIGVGGSCDDALQKLLQDWKKTE